MLTPEQITKVRQAAGSQPLDMGGSVQTPAPQPLSVRLGLKTPDEQQPKAPENELDSFTKFNRNVAKSLVVDPAKALLVKPAARTAEAIGRTGILGENIKSGYEQMADEGESQTFFKDPAGKGGIEVNPIRGGVSGAKQIAGEAIEAGVDLATISGGPAAFKGATGVNGLVKGAISGAKTGALVGGTYGGGLALGKSLQDDENIQDIGENTLKGLATGAVTGGVLGAVTGGISGAINRRNAVKDILKTSNLDRDTANALKADFQPGGNNTNHVQMYDTLIKSGDMDASKIYKGGDLTKKVYTPEIAKTLLKDAQDSLIRDGHPELASALAKNVNVNNLTPDTFIQAGNNLIDDAQKIPADLIKYKIVDGKKVIDNKANEALKVGIDDQDVAFIKNASNEDKKIFQRSLEIAKRASKDKTVTEQAIQEPGKIIVEQARTINRARSQIGSQLGALKKELAKTPVDITDDLTKYIDDLSDSGVVVNPEGLDFSASRYARTPSVQKVLSNTYDDLAGIGQKGNVQSVDTARQALSTQVDLGGKAGTFDDNALRILNNLDKGLRTKISGVNPKYAQLSTDYSKLKGSLDDLQDLVGKDFNVLDEGASLKAGEVGRRILGNSSAKVLSIIDDAQNIARQYGFDKKVDLKNQFLFASFLDDFFGNVKPHSLQGQVARGFAKGGVDTAKDIVAGKAGSITSRLLDKTLSVVNNVSPERKESALRALIQ